MPRKKNIGHANNIFIIATISFGHLCHDIYSSFLSPILPLLIDRFALTYTSAGLISVMLRLPSIFSPLIGALADRINLKYFLILSPSLTAISICLIGSAPNFYVILLLAITAGITAACFHVPAPVVLKKLAGERVGAAMSAFQIGGELSRTIGPLLVLWAVSIWGLSGIYHLIPIGILASFFLYRVLRDVPSSRSSQRRRKLNSSITKTLLHKKLLFISIAGILLCKCFSASVLGAFLPVYLIDRGESLWFAGMALSLLQAFAIAGVFITGNLSDKIGCAKLLIILTLAAPLTMLLCVYSHGWLFIASLCMAGLFAFSSTPVIMSLIQKSGFEFPVIANGIYMTLNFMLSSIIVLIAGKLSDMSGIITTFKYCAVCSFIGIPFALFLTKKHNSDG